MCLLAFKNPNTGQLSQSVESESERALVSFSREDGKRNIILTTLYLNLQPTQIPRPIETQ
jgi:hypothetical protein